MKAALPPRVDVRPTINDVRDVDVRGAGRLSILIPPES